MFNSLQPLVEQSHSYELKEELQQAQQTYETMLRYMVRGVDDPNSSNIYSQLKQKAYSISDRANRLIRLEKMSSDRYSITQKLLKEESLDTILMALETQDSAIHRLEKETERESIKEHELAELRNSREATLRSMFENVWTSGLWRKSNYESATAIINSDSIAIPGKALLISAVTLALLEMFDQRKMMLLFDAYLSTELELSQRALVGIVLCMRFYDERLSQFPEIGSRFSLYTEDPKFVQDFFRILMQLQYSKMTDTIDSKMRNDIIPSLLQSGKFKQTQYGIQEIDDYMTKNGENPEWHHNKNDEKAQEKIQEMAELQMDGADVYMSSFVHMKNYPFFQQIFHWFMPFDVENPLVASSMKKISTLFCALLMLLPFSAAGQTLSCDVNGDNEVNIADVNEVIKVILDFPVAFDETCADVNRDGEVNIADVNTIIHWIQEGPFVNESTCADVIAGPVGEIYRVKGRVDRIINTIYGNWYLVDETGEIYIYGTLDANGLSKNFLSLGIEEGDIVTVEGPKGVYNGLVELIDVTVLNIVMATWP